MLTFGFARLPVFVVHTAADRPSVHRVTEHDNGAGLDNDEQGTDVSLCTGPAESWSRIWPRFRHLY